MWTPVGKRRVGWIQRWGLTHIHYWCCCSVAKSCPSLCDPLDCSTLSFQVFRYCLDFAQSHVTEVVMPSSHLILCRLLLLLPSLFSSILLCFFVLILLILWCYILYLFYRELCRTSCIVQGSLLSDLWWPKEKGKKKPVNICTCLGAQLCPTLWPYGL